MTDQSIAAASAVELSCKVILKHSDMLDEVALRLDYRKDHTALDAQLHELEVATAELHQSAELLRLELDVARTLDDDPINELFALAEQMLVEWDQASRAELYERGSDSDTKKHAAQHARRAAIIRILRRTLERA